MKSRSIPKRVMRRLLNNALKNTYCFNSGSFENESDFHLEVYHNLANLEYNGIPLCAKVPETDTCYLHSEGKCENGNAKKADLLICNPYVLQRFNYKVDYIIELKHKLHRNDVESEIKKIESYHKAYKQIYIISGEQTSLNLGEAKEVVGGNSNAIEIIQPNMVVKKPSLNCSDSKRIGLSGTLRTVHRCIRETLELYGNGRQQYHGFFWCNYEDEQTKGQTYPCNTDFICQLYHRLRCCLPPNIVVQKDHGDIIKLEVISEKDSWCIPITVDMNWDQFRPEKNKEHKAVVFVDRFLSIRSKYGQSRPITIVIQGSLGHDNDNKPRAMSILRNAKIKFDLMCYDERKSKPMRIPLGKKLRKTSQ